MGSWFAAAAARILVPLSLVIRRVGFRPVVVVVCLGAVGVAPAIGAGQLEPQIPAEALSADNPRFGVSMKREEAKGERLRTPAARAERQRSRTRHRGLTRTAALALGKAAFPDEFVGQLFDGSQPDRGMKVVERLRGGAAIAETASGQKTVLQSSAPLVTESAAGDEKPVDLTLASDDAGFRTRNALVDLRIAKRSGDGVEFPDGGFSVAPGGQTDVAAVESTDRVFFANTQTDTDFMVAPRPAGAELGWQLRSPYSPQRLTLDVDMPAGAVLRKARTDTPIPGDPPTSFEIAKDDKALGYLHQPNAYDSDGVPVRSHAKIDGDTVVVTVEHREGDYRYPLFVDPEMQINDYAGNNWAGWDPAINGSYGYAKNNCAYYCNGLYLSMPTNTYFPPSGSSVNWQYRAKPDTYIYGGTLGGITHEPSAWPGYPYPYVWSRWFNGIFNGSFTNWEANTNYVNQDGIAGPNPFGPTWGGASGKTHAFCLNGPNGRCGRNNPPATEQNAMILGLFAQNDINSANINTLGYKGAVKMAWSMTYLYDSYNPWMVSPQPPHKDWTDDTATPTHQLGTVSAIDKGLGMGHFKLARAGATTGTQQVTQFCLGDPNRTPCPLRSDLPAPGYTLNEGVTTLTLTPFDIVDRAGGPQIWTQKIDRSKPKDIVLSGSAWDARTHIDDDDGDAGGLFESQATLNVSARDDHSGVASIELLIDGQRIKPAHFAPTAGCTSDGCPTSNVTASFTIERNDLTLGDHPIKVVVRDVLGNSQPAAHSDHAAFTLYSDGPQGRTDPSASTPDDPNGDATEPAPAATCEADPDFAADDCLPDEQSELVQAVRSEPHVGSLLNSLLLLGSSIAQPRASAAQEQAANGACALGDPISSSVSVEQGRRFGLSDQSSYAGTRDRNEPDIFDADPRPGALNLRRVRLVLPFDVVVRAMAQKSATTQACKDYKAAYTWILNAVTASPTREPLISFERRRSPTARTFRPTPTQYRVAIKAFMDQFPVVRTYTAWNEPNRKGYQPTSGATPALSAEGARVAGRYWRTANDLCQRGRRCLVAAGDFLDDASQNLNYRSNYFKGMGSPDRVALWAYHPYGAILYGPTSTQGTRLTQFLGSRITEGSEIWYSEAGAFAMQTPASDPSYSAANNLAKQSSDLARFFGSSQFTSAKVKRFYYYSWSSSPGRVTDSGLVGVGDRAPIGFQPTPAAAPSRPIYCTYRARTNPGNQCG